MSAFLFPGGTTLAVIILYLFYNTFNMKKILLIMTLFITCGVYSQIIPSKERFTEVCDSLGIHHPNVVYAQARLESGNFKTDYYKRTRNCLGIYDSTRKRYKTFRTWIDCLVSYRDGVQYKCRNTGGSDEDYLQWIVSIGYASDPEYGNKVRKILKLK